MDLQVSIRIYRTYKAEPLPAFYFRNSDRIYPDLPYRKYKSNRPFQAFVYRSSDRTYLDYLFHIRISKCLCRH